MSSGARNLLILGIISTVISIATAGISLAFYHNSGDIYLDRSRPGYLPDEEEIEKQDEIKEVEYQLETSGEITEELLTEYLEKLEEEIKSVDAYQKPFDIEALSNERLGL